MPRRDLPLFRDLRGFTSYLEEHGELVRVGEPVSVVHEITEIHRRTLQAGGPALLFESPVLPDGSVATMPMLVNLFGTKQRVAWGFGVAPTRLKELGNELAELRDPRPPRDFADAMSKLPLARAAMKMRPKQPARRRSRRSCSAETPSIYPCFRLRSAGRASPGRSSPGLWSLRDRRTAKPTTKPMSASTECKSSDATASFFVGLPIAAAPAIIINGRHGAPTCR